MYLELCVRDNSVKRKVYCARKFDFSCTIVNIIFNDQSTIADY